MTAALRLPGLDVAGPDPAAPMPMPMPMPPLPGRALTKRDLRARGWTDRGIARFLGEPDATRRNPCSHFRPTCLYSAARVAAAEASAAFVAWKRQRDLRSERSRRGAATQAENLAAEMAAWTPYIKRLPIEELRRLAIDHYNARLTERAMWRAERGYDNDELPRLADEESTPHFLERLMVNYLRHRRTNYDGKLQALAGRIGRERAVVLVKRRVFEVIAGVYPELAEEAREQMAARGGTDGT